ncbi:alpha-L-rhamnosidase C-terminal domain-containing protein [Paenibacillus sp. GCM10027626]|uniref:alpha-L-rhamnosidase C-terminal domain-containing protein n=1 Tax=Paenibacillus sp. GCM10027626 TaxID=3273411 RepID=UPI0036392233
MSGILGVKPIAAGFEKIRIAPQPCGLTWAKGSVPTPLGMVEIAWEIVQDIMHVDVQAPDGMKYTVELPEEYRK